MPWGKFLKSRYGLTLAALILSLTGVAIEPAYADTPMLQWAVALPTPITAPVTTPDGKVVVGGSNGKLYAYTKYGVPSWTYTTGGSIVAPAVSDPLSTIYSGSNDGNLYAVTTTGTHKWPNPFRTGIPPFIPVSSIVASPTFVGDNGLYLSATSGYVYSLNPENASLNWTFKMAGEGRASPMADSSGNVYIGDFNGWVYAISPTGIQLWKYNTGSKILGRPAIGPDGTIYVGTNSNGLYAFNPDGTLKWRFHGDGNMQFMPVIGSDGTIYANSYAGNLFAINPDGTKKWSFKSGNRLTGSPTLDEAGIIYLAGSDGRLQAINPDGTVNWNFCFGVTMLGSVSLNDNWIFVSGTNSTLYAFTTSGPAIPEPATLAQVAGLFSVGLGFLLRRKH